jgi:hypothetical protein
LHPDHRTAATAGPGEVPDDEADEDEEGDGEVVDGAL